MACGLQLKCLGLRGGLERGQGRGRGKTGREEKIEEEERKERKEFNTQEKFIRMNSLSLSLFVFPSTGLSLKHLCMFYWLSQFPKSKEFGVFLWNFRIGI